MTINVALVENRLLVAMGLRQLLEAEGDIRVLDIKTDCHTPCAQDCMQPMPDVLVMEPTLDDACGLDCIHRIIARQPEARILALSHDDNAVTAQHALCLGALGFIGKDATADELLEAVRTVAIGKEYIGRDTGRSLLTHRFLGEATLFQALTRREHEIMLLILEGRAAAEISQSLCISTKTLANHHTRILRKLDVSNLVELTRLAIRHGIIKAIVLFSAGLTELFLLF